MVEKKYFYLIRNRKYSDQFLIKDCKEIYSSEIGQTILNKLPEDIPENGNLEHQVIRSDNILFKGILQYYLSNSASGLNTQIEELKDKLSAKKRYRDLTIKTLEELK